MVSMSPKNWFHDAIADHEDRVICDHPSDTSSCLHEKPFNCGFDDLVVKTNYTESQININISLPIYSQDPDFDFISYHANDFWILEDERGPPAG